MVADGIGIVGAHYALLIASLLGGTAFIFFVTLLLTKRLSFDESPKWQLFEEDE